MSIKIEVDKADLRELQEAFERMRVRSTSTVGQWIKGAAITAQNEAKSESPVDTGRLKGSIRFLVEDNGLEAWIYTNVKYAKYQNDGTSKIKGKFFMEKGHAAARRYLVKRIKRSNKGLG